MATFHNFFIVPIFDAMEIKIETYHNKGMDMLNLECTLSILAVFV